MNLAKKRILALMGCALFLALAAGFIFFFRKFRGILQNSCRGAMLSETLP